MPAPDEEPQIDRTPSGGVFISHIHEDREIAEAFSTLVRDVTAGMVQTYSSSSTSSDAGIKYGDEWFQWIRDRVETADHVVALLTPRSVGKPWILFEAGLGKAQTATTMFGVAVGMSVADASVGPFGVFQNSSADKKSLVKLCEQLATRANLRPRTEIIEDMVDRFIATVESTIPQDEPVVEDPQSAALFQAIEDLKFLVREQRLREPRPPQRPDRDTWRATVSLLEEDALPPAIRRRILSDAAAVHISPLIGTLAEETFNAIPRSGRLTARYLDLLDRALSETRMGPQNDWLFHFLRREMSGVLDQASDAEIRRERMRERQAEIRMGRAPTQAEGGESNEGDES